MLFTGDRHIDTLEQRIAAVHAAAREAGRDPAKIDIWAVSFASIRETRAQAIDDLKAFIVVNGMALRTPEVLATVPTQFRGKIRSEEHTSELQSLMRISYAVFCLKKKTHHIKLTS